MVENSQYQAIIIGTGQSGNPLASALANAGWNTAVIESDLVGGTCINYGCTPTKTMVASASIAHLVSRAGEFGVEVSDWKLDLGKVLKRKQAVVDSFRNSSENRLENTENLDFFRGTARFKSSTQIEILSKSRSEKVITGENIIINTGALPAIPDIPGLDTVNYLDSTSIMELEEVPEHLIILGGGYIGLEFGQMFKRFGSAVSIIQRGDQLLTREDRDVAEGIAEILKEDGVDIFLNARVVQIESNVNGQLSVKVHQQGKNISVDGSHLLVATGRIPRSAELNLEKAGVATDERGYIQINEFLQTDIPNIYVTGDVKGGPAFTHISYDDFRILRDNLLEGKKKSISKRLVPYTVFIDPQLGRVGLSENEARKAGYQFKVAKMPMAYVARAIEMGQTRGFMKVLVEENSEKILGCAILGVEGGEMMSLLQLAMMGDLPYSRLQEGIFTHPTLAESLNNLFSNLE
jgi:pyruvate/2-oxoglutarate dehydrogenase complex dihydrolipoamide dehydrogenase (E3) component